MHAFTNIEDCARFARDCDLAGLHRYADAVDEVLGIRTAAAWEPQRDEVLWNMPRSMHEAILGDENWEDEILDTSTKKLLELQKRLMEGANFRREQAPPQLIAELEIVERELEAESAAIEQRRKQRNARLPAVGDQDERPTPTLQKLTRELQKPSTDIEQRSEGVVERVNHLTGDPFFALGIRPGSTLNEAYDAFAEMRHYYDKVKVQNPERADQLLSIWTRALHALETQAKRDQQGRLWWNANASSVQNLPNPRSSIS
jgi:hypothetical protein